MTSTELDFHDCGWREIALEQEKKLISQEAKIISLESQLSELRRRIFGKRSEKMPSIKSELQKNGEINHDAGLKTRQERSNKASLPKVIKNYQVAAENRHCPNCNNKEMKPLGDGKKSYTIEYFPARF
jgi:transposase